MSVEREEKTYDLISILAFMQQDDFDQTIVIKELREIYIGGCNGSGSTDQTESTYRHSYSDISRYIYQRCATKDGFDTSAAELMIEHLQEILDALEPGKEKEDKRLYRSLEKLRDHISLELVRMGQQEDVYVRLQHLQMKADEVAVLIDRADESLRKQEALLEKVSQQEAHVEKMEETIDNSNAQSVTVLSIFAGMAFIFTGGFTVLSGSLSVLSGITVERSFLLMSVLILLGAVLIDAVWILLRSTRKYMGGETKMPIGFYVFNTIAAGLTIVLFLFFVFHS